MNRCKLKAGEPCLRYEKANPDALISFVKANGGPVPTFRKDGTAEIITLIKDKEKTVFLQDGSWLRSIKLSMFIAHSDEFFRTTYELVGEKPLSCAKNCGVAPKLTPMHDKDFAQILDKQ